MVNIKEYLQKKEKREEKKEADDFNSRIRKHRFKVFFRTTAIVVLTALVCAAVYINMENQTYSSYTLTHSVVREIYDNTTQIGYLNGFISYSKDGISYIDSNGETLWNQTYEMQSPIIKISGNRVAVADYNGHMIYEIDEAGTIKNIDTNLPIRSLALAENGIVAAAVEDGNTTYINLYNPSGERFAYIRTRMESSGYPIAMALSATGELLAVSYLQVESGSMVSHVAFYNFDSVGQNSIDHNVSGYNYKDTIVPYLCYMNESTAYAIADNGLKIYTDSHIPKSSFEKLMDEEIVSVYSNDEYIGLVFHNTDGQEKYRLDVYNKSGEVVTSQKFDFDYKEIVFHNDQIVIYNESECRISTVKGIVKYEGEFGDSVVLLRPISSRRYLMVKADSVNIMELRG